MCCLEGIIPRGEQPKQEPYPYQGIKIALGTLARNLKLYQGINVVLVGELF